VFCQSEILRECLPCSVRRFLGELLESLDETYERVLREIKKPDRDHARRLLQCLVLAIRLLRVEELAEVLAVDFDDAKGIPKLKAGWRWED
jgi:preprotein translocase subunit Sss1